MSDRTDPAWDEYLSTGIDPTGGELEAADEENFTDEIIPGEWQQYSRHQYVRIWEETEEEELKKLRVHERIRANRERIKWERENPKKAKTLTIVKGIVAIGYLISMIVAYGMMIKGCSWGK